MSFARNFALGQKIASDLIDTYYTTKERRAIEEAKTAKPEDLGAAYTEADAEQLHAIANATDAEGNPYYDVIPMANGRYGIKPRFQYQDSSGQMVQPDAPVATIAPTLGVQEFLGVRYKPGELTPEKMQAARTRAIANAIRDPITSQRMLLEAERAEREADQYAWERGLRPFKEKKYGQEITKGGLEIAALERAAAEQARALDVQKTIDEALNLPEEQLQMMAQQLQPRQSPYPIYYSGKTDGGYRFVTLDPQSGERRGSITLTPFQARQLAAAYMLGQKGFGAEAMTMLREANKDLYELIKVHNEAEKDVTSSYNTATRNERRDAYEQEQLRLQRLGLLSKSREREPTYDVKGGLVFYNGQIVGRIDPVTNSIAPMETNPFEGKKGEKLMVGWANKGVVQVVVQDVNGFYRYGYVSVYDPKRRVWDTPDEAFEAGQQAKQDDTNKRTGLPPPIINPSNSSQPPQTIKHQPPKGGWTPSPLLRGLQPKEAPN